MKRLTVGSLFSGIGGIDLGLQRAGMEIRWHSEIDPYASRVLAKHWPDVPNHGDITQIDFAQVEPVDVLAGGFPCQDISNAGKREGIDGERSGLWSQYARAIGELRPRYVFVENVAALLARGIDRVLGEMAALGYDAEWDCIPASAVGAPHRRDRLWIVAHTARSGRHGWPAVRPGRQAGNIPSRGDESVHSRAVGTYMANPDCSGLEGRQCEGVRECATERTARARSSPMADAHRGNEAPQSGVFPREAIDATRTGGQWFAEPDVGRVADGVPRRVDRLRGLGNAVVPQIPELIGGWIIEHARATGYLESAA